MRRIEDRERKAAICRLPLPVFLIPLAGDSSLKAPESEGFGSASADSELFDVIGPYVNEHAVSQAFTVKTEGGARFSEKAAKDELCTWTLTRCVVLAGTK